MENTYTYTARSAENPERVVTFTLHNTKMSVGAGVPLEQLEQAIARLTAEEEDEETPEAELWLKPLAVSLVERGTGPFNIEDVDADVDGDRLSVTGWVRLAGLRGGAITLMEGRIDNVAAATAFVDELESRKADLAKPVLPFDYWLTWVGMITSLVIFFVFWQRRRNAPRAAEGEQAEGATT